MKTTAAVRQNPRSAELTYRATTRWEEAVRCTARVRRFAPLTVDEPAAFGGGDTAMSPVDLVLSALGTCQEIMYAAIAATMDIPLESVRVTLKGRLDLHGLLGLGASKGIPPGLQEIEFETEIRSEASEEELRRLIDAVEARCPILDTLLRPVRVSGKAIINGVSVHAAQESAA